MRLLSKNEIKQRKNFEQAKEVVFGTKVKNEIDKSRRELNKLKDELAEYNKLVEQMPATLIKEITDKKRAVANDIKKLTGLKETIIAGEDKDKIIEELKVKEKEAIKVAEQEEAALRTEKILYALKRTDLTVEEKRLKDFEVELKDRLVVLNERNDDVTKRNQASTEMYAKEMKAISLGKKDLEQNTKKLKQKNQALDILQEANQKEKDDIAKDRIKLESQQETLRQAFAEAKKKGLI